MKPIIAICPVDLAKDPRFAHLRSPITIEHTLYDCPECGTEGWIGPTQLKAAQGGVGDVMCYRCLFAMENVPTAFEVRSLNPDIEPAPRRWQ